MTSIELKELKTRSAKGSHDLVWILVPDNNVEGYGRPLGAYLTRQDAYRAALAFEKRDKMAHQNPNFDVVACPFNWWPFK